MMQLPESLKLAINRCPLIVGIGPSAWPRLVSSFYFPKFEILTHYDCQDNDLIARSGVKVFSLKAQQPDLEVSPVTPAQILKTDLVQKHLADQKEPFAILVYKSSSLLEKICLDRGWQLIANRKELAERFENKKNFKEILLAVGLEPIPGENLLIEKLTFKKVRQYQKRFGQNKIVLQLAEVTSGGGSGTLFVEKASDFRLFQSQAAEFRQRFEGKKKKITSVNIAPYIPSISASVSCCATRFGTLVGPIQTQIIDIKEVGTQIKGRSGNYAGTDWGFRHFAADYQQQAGVIAKKFGRYLYQQGYRGIFGLDLLVDEKAGKVWPMECNPRDTDAFPMISFLQMEAGLIPFDVFHNLELMNADYKFDYSEMLIKYQQRYASSQVIIHNNLGQEAVNRGILKAGVYRVKNNHLDYQRSGFWLSDLKTPQEYLITEGVPKNAGNFYFPAGRIFRLISRDGFLANEGSLRAETKKIIGLIYQQLKLTPVEIGLAKDRGLAMLNTGRLDYAVRDEKLKSVNMVNVFARTENGFYRPLKVAWRKKIDLKTPIIDQIHSKRARKQIKADEKRLANIGIYLQVCQPINPELFSKWYRLYQKIIFAKEKGKPAIKPDWLAKKMKEGKKVGAVFAFQGQKLIGGNLFLEMENRFCVGYGVAERIPGLAGGLGLLLDYRSLELAQKKGFSEVSLGQDTNLYGWELTPGLLFYKAKLGFSPCPANKTIWVTSYFRDFRPFTDPIIFFSGAQSELEMTVISDKESTADLYYLPLAIEKCRVLVRKEVVEQTLQLFAKIESSLSVETGGFFIRGSATPDTLCRGRRLSG